MEHVSCLMQQELHTPRTQVLASGREVLLLARRDLPNHEGVHWQSELVSVDLNASRYPARPGTV